MIQTIRLFLLLEGASFVAAALVHFGVLIAGFDDRAAAIAESVIGGVLLIGWATTSVWPAGTRLIGLATQAFALLGTLVGATLTIFVGPSTAPDIAYHLIMLVVLAWGLVVAARAPADGERASPRINDREA